MPITKSAKKRVRVASKNTARNVRTKRNLKTALKAFQGALTGGKKASESHASAQSALDKAGKKRVLHKNKVARKKRQLAATAKASGVKLAGAKATKKTVSKPASKSSAKKAPAKKPATKKTSVKKK